MSGRVRTLPGALAEAARSGEGYTFLGRGGERRCAYADLERQAFGVARALGEAGLRRGDLVALVIDDAEAFLTALFGASIAGVIPAPLSPPSLAADPSQYLALAAGMLRTARARAVIASRALVARFESARRVCPDLACVLPRDALDAPPLAPAALPRPDDIAFVQFTSGSTSAPKGVALSHASLAANIDAINGPAGLATTPDDSAVSWLPLHHDMGLVGMALGPLYASRPAVLLTPEAFVKRPADWLKAIARHRATVSFAPTFGYDLVVRRLRDRDLEGLDLSCWRVAGCGAEAIHAPTLAAFAERLAGAGFRPTSFFPCYGLAEHVLAAALPPRDRVPRVDQRFVSCGRALPDHRIRIIKEDGGEAADREIGEIALAGPSLMLGYYRDPAATAEAIRDGWLRTGDLGYLAGGELFVCGRVREVIVANGRKYHPQDLEWALGDIAGLGRGRAVAFGAARAGESDRVVIVVEAAPEPARALADAIRRRIGEMFGLYVDEIVPTPGGTIGRTTSGKVQRAATKAWYEQRRP